MSVVLLKIWHWILSSRIVQGAILVAGLIGWHALKIMGAKREGKQDERERINREADQESQEIEERADETRERNRDLSGDDLRRRMREQARSRRKP